jgi:hypothetical protein
MWYIIVQFGTVYGHYYNIYYTVNYTTIVPPADFKYLQFAFCIQLWKPWCLALVCAHTRKLHGFHTKSAFTGSHSVKAFESCPPPFILRLLRICLLCKVDNFTTICDLIVWKMEPRHLTTLWTFTVCYRDIALPLLLSLCLVAMAVEAMCKYYGSICCICDSNPHPQFIYYRFWCCCYIIILYLIS